MLSAKVHKKKKTAAPAQVPRVLVAAPLVAFYRLLALLLDLALAQLLCEWSSVWWADEVQGWWQQHVAGAYSWGLWWAMVFALAVVMRFITALCLGLTPGQWPMGIRQVEGNLLLAGLRTLLSTLLAPILLFHLPLLLGKRAFADWATGTRLQLNHPWLGRMGLLLFCPMLFVPLLAPIYFSPALWNSHSLGQRPVVILQAPVDFKNLETLAINPMGMELLLDKSAVDFSLIPFKSGQGEHCLWFEQNAQQGEWCLRKFTPWSHVSDYLALRQLPLISTPLADFSRALDQLVSSGDYAGLSRSLPPLLQSSILNTPMMFWQFGLMTPVYWQLKRLMFSDLLDVSSEIFAQEWGRALSLRAINQKNQEQLWLVLHRHGMAFYHWRGSSAGNQLLEQVLQGVGVSAPGLTSVDSYVPFWSDRPGRQQYYQQLLTQQQELGHQSAVLFLRKLMQE